MCLKNLIPRPLPSDAPSIMPGISATINDLRKSEFLKVTTASVVESHPHDVTITREAPNYSRK